MSTTRLCAHCATRFESRRADKQYCSGACRSAASRARRRARNGRRQGMETDTAPAGDTARDDTAGGDTGAGVSERVGTVSDAVLDAALGLDTGSEGDTPAPPAPAGDLAALADRVALLETSLNPTLDWDQVSRKLDELAETAVSRESQRMRRRLVQQDREVASLRQELGRLQQARTQPPAVDRRVAQRIVALERKLAGLRSSGPEVARLREELATVRRRAAASERELTQRLGALEEALEAWAGVMSRVVDLAT